MITGLGGRDGRFRRGKVNPPRRKSQGRKIQAKNKGKSCRTNQEAGSVEGRTGFEVSRPETESTRTLLQIGLRRSSFHLKRSQGLGLKLHFKENAFS